MKDPLLDRKSKEKRQPWGNMPHVVTIMSGVCSLKKNMLRFTKFVNDESVHLLTRFSSLGKF